MKTTSLTLFFICAVLICTTSAFGQAAGSISSQAQPTQVPDHPQHASVHDMATEQSLVGGNAYTWAQGERPLWEFGEVTHQPSLGDVARAYRKEKTTAKKAEIILEKQGS